MINLAKLNGLILICFLGIALFGLIDAAVQSDQNWIFDSYLLTILEFTLKQAFLSTLISLCLGLILAKCLQMLSFRFKSIFVSGLQINFILPQFIVIPALISIYGKSGWINQLLEALELPFSFSIYGLSGILIAHVFLNLPFVAFFCFTSLTHIPDQQKQLADSLRLSHWQRFKWLEWGLLKKQLIPLSCAIFMLCFVSFAIVLTLGGGPKSTTIEVAIYHFIRELDYQSAFILGAIQFLFAFFLMRYLNHFTLSTTIQTKSDSAIGRYLVFYPSWQKKIARTILIGFALFLFLPICALIGQGVFYFKFSFLTFGLVKAFGLSCLIAFCAACFTLFVAISFIYWLSQLKKQKQKTRFILLIVQSIFLFSPILISSGLFLLFFAYSKQKIMISIFMILLNSLFALPFVFGRLNLIFQNQIERYQHLAQTLHLSKLRFLYLGLYLPFKKEILAAFKLGFILTLGDFSLILYFGQRDFATLTYYLYDLIGHYRFHEAISIAMLFYLFILAVLTLNKIPNNKTEKRTTKRKINE